MVLFSTKTGSPSGSASQERDQHRPRRDLDPSFPVSKEEQFYVIENAYQQLVFSNVGGALAEINLPLYSKENPSSPVRPIEFDRVMLQDFPYNDKFPSRPYSIHNGSNIEKNVQGTTGGYYPLLRRAIFSKKGNPNFQVPPRYYGLNIVSDEPDLPSQIYQLKRLEKNLIEFQLQQPHRKITKTYAFSPSPDNAPFTVEVAIKVEGDARGLFVTTGVPEVELISGNPEPFLKYRVIRSNNKAQIEKISLPKETTSFTSLSPDWVCNANGYFGMILDPVAEIGSGFKSKPRSR